MSDPAYVVAGGGTLEVGKNYVCRHCRKGIFSLRITKLDGEWIEGVIIKGTANAIMSYNVKSKGEEITIRACHSYFTPLESPTATPGGRTE